MIEPIQELAENEDSDLEMGGGLEPLGGDPLGDDPFAAAATDDAPSLNVPEMEPLSAKARDPLMEAISELESSLNNKPEETKASSFNQKIFGVPVEVQVLIGSTMMSVSELMSVKNDSVVTLNAKVGDPVSLSVNGLKIGAGELEVSEDDPETICVRITRLGH